MEELHHKCLPKYIVYDISAKDEEKKLGTLILVRNMSKIVVHIPYSLDNTGDFPKDFKAAMYQEPIYVNDIPREEALLSLYANSYVVLPKFLRVEVQNLTPGQLYYLNLFLQSQDYLVSDMGNDMIQCDQGRQCRECHRPK